MFPENTTKPNLKEGLHKSKGVVMPKKPTVARDPFFPDTVMYSFVHGHYTGARKVFTGDLRQCLAHLKSRGVEADRLHYLVDEISNFIGAAERTVRDWLDGVYLPKGVRLIRLQYYLSCLGYQLTEIMGMPSLLCRLREAVAWGQISPKDMAKELGLSTSKVLELLYSSSWRTIDGNVSLMLKLCRLNADLRQAEEDELMSALRELSDMAATDYCEKPSRRSRRSRARARR